MRKVVVDIINKLNIDDIEYKNNLIDLVDSIFMGRNTIDIMVREHNGTYYVYTFVNSNANIKERFIYGKYKTTDRNETINIIISHLLHHYVRVKSHEIFGWDELFEVTDEVLKFESDLLDKIIVNLPEDTKEYCRNNNGIYSLTEDIIDTDFYRNWVLT